MLIVPLKIFISLRYPPKHKAVRKESGSGANQFYLKNKVKMEETNSWSSWTAKVLAQKTKMRNMTLRYSVFPYWYQQWLFIIHNKASKKNQLKVLLWHPNCATESSTSRQTVSKKRKAMGTSKMLFIFKTISRSLVSFGYSEISCWVWKEKMGRRCRRMITLSQRYHTRGLKIRLIERSYSKLLYNVIASPLFDQWRMTKCCRSWVWQISRRMDCWDQSSLKVWKSLKISLWIIHLRNITLIAQAWSQWGATIFQS